MTARSKVEATARMYGLAGEDVQPLGPGSKEKKSALEALGRALGMDLTQVRTKSACGEQIAHRLDVVWDADCFSTGDTITLVGMNRLLDAYDVRHPQNNELYESETRPVTEEKTDLEIRVAEAIANLSGAEVVPEGFAADRPTISGDDVDFYDGSWRTHLGHVADWLHFDAGSLDQSSPTSFDHSLALGLGLDAAWRSGTADPVRQALLPRLADRLDRALVLKEFFDDEMEGVAEGTTTLSSATKSWAAKWEEAVEDEEASGSGTIHAEADTWPITEFIGHAEAGELNLSPSFQRADVWATTMSQELIESVLRGIPLPSIIILDKVDRETEETTYEVVDGKQRLTSILRFTGTHPAAVDLVNKLGDEWGEESLLKTFQTDYPTFKKLWKKHSKVSLVASVERKNYFPFPLRSGDQVKPLSGPLEKLKGKYYCQIKDEGIPVLGVTRKVKSLFEQSATSYKVPVITYKDVKPEQIHEVFSLYNKQGKHLNAEEIRNALYHHLDLMKALVVTAGDSGTVERDAAFLLPAWADLKSTEEVLDKYGFGHAGYKRTKLLSWVCATLLLEDMALPGRSTTNHINALLKRVADTPKDPLRRPEVLLKAMVLLDDGLDAHADVDATIWAPTFVNTTKSGKWQELQLVAALVALCAASSIHGKAVVDVLEAKHSAVQAKSATWERPKKTQSKDQWVFIATVVKELLEVLDVSVEQADARLRDDFGSSGLLSLVGVAGR